MAGGSAGFRGFPPAPYLFDLPVNKFMNIDFATISSSGALALNPIESSDNVNGVLLADSGGYDIAADLELARRIASGDMCAFEELYSLYYRRIFALCYRMTRSQYEAEDLTHDIFVHVYKKIQSFRGQSALMTWLHRVTVNQVLMHFRRKSARPKEVSSDTELDAHYPTDSIDATVSSGPARIELETAISALPPGYRLVLLLHDVEGYEHGEISRIAGISVGTSKSQLHKARRKLRKLINRGQCESVS